jgi:hypothetical protein
MNHIYNLASRRARMNAGPFGVVGHEKFTIVKDFFYQQKPDYPYSLKAAV